MRRFDFEEPDDQAFYCKQAMLWPTELKKKYKTDEDAARIESIRTSFMSFINGYYRCENFNAKREQLYSTIPIEFMNAKQPYSELMMHVLHNFSPEQIAELLTY